MYFLVFHNLGENALRIICTTMQLSSQEPGTVSSARQELLLPFCRWDHRVTASLTRGSRMWHGQVKLSSSFPCFGCLTR